MIFHRVEELAKRKRVSMAQVALAWILNREGVTAPVVGTTSLESLQELIGMLRTFSILSHSVFAIDAVDMKLSPEEMQFLEEPYKPQAVFGHW